MYIRVIALVGLSGHGKTGIIDEACQQDTRLQKVRSITTRAWREPSDDEIYDFISPEELQRLKNLKGIAQSDTYSGFEYGNTFQQFAGVADQGKIGILSMTEQGTHNIRAKGYDVRVIHVIARNAPIRPGREDEDPDLLKHLVSDYVNLNDYGPEGYRRAIEEVIAYISTCFNE